MFSFSKATRARVREGKELEVMSVTQWEWRKRYEEDKCFLAVPRCLLGVVSTSAALVYSAIVNEDIDCDNVVLMKQSKISQITGITDRQVRRAISELITYDLIEPEPERTGKGNIYRITVRLLGTTPEKRRDAARRAQEIAHTSSVREVCPENIYFRDMQREG